MAFTITGNISIGGGWVGNSSGPSPSIPPVSITAVAGATTTVLATQNIAIASFSPFSSVTNGITPYYYYVSSGVLPAGITINSSTGVVSGTPTNTYSSANVTFSVVDAYSTLATTTATVNFTVNAIITATAGATTTVTGEQTIAIASFSPFSSVTGGYTPYVYGIVSGTLPTGITLNTSTGLVSGTPSTAYSSANVVFKVTDNLGTQASTTVTVNFTIVGVITATAGATTTVTGEQTLAITSFNPFSSVSSGTTPYFYYVSAGTLPTGITINSSTGLVSGTPTVTYATASVTFSVRDANSVVATTTSTVSFTVNAALSATAGATTTVTGEQTLAITGFNTFSSVTGGYTPYVYGIVSGTLPGGITLNTGNGYVSGTPSTTLTGNVVFKVTDNLSTIASTTSTVNFNIATRISAVAGATTTISGVRGVPIGFYPFSSVSNGVGAYTYYISSGTLPAGVTLDTTTGIVSGTPTTAQAASNVVFSVKDSLNVSAVTTVTVSFTVVTSISAVAGGTTTVSAIQSTAITSFNAFTSVSNGYTPYVYSVSSGTLPIGINLNTSTGLVSGTPTATYATASVTFTVTDAQGYIAATTTTTSFTVNAAITASAGATTTVSQQQNTAITSFNPFSSVSGGYTPYTYYVFSGTLPPGVLLDTSTGLVSGTPNTVQAASNVVFKVKDSQNSVAATSVTVSFTVTAPPATPYTVNYLVVAGGGGGGKSAAPGTSKGGGGGGGGGGFTTGSYPQNPGTVLSITVGGGGSAGSAGAGGNGTQSTLTGATTATGGGGGSGFTPTGVNASGGSPGGSGGGGANNGNCTPYGGYTPQGGGSGSQGHAGGSSGASPGGPPFPNQGYGGGGGGGGGAGSSGNNGTIGPDTPFNAAWTGVGGPGGTGSTWTYTGATLYAGGGGGGGGIYLTPAPSGPSSYGGGGAGGSSPGGTSQPGAAGTAGVVILAVPTPQYSGTKTGGTTSNPPAAPGQTVITWTSPGSYTV